MDTETDRKAPRRLQAPNAFDDFYRRSWHEIYRPLAATIGDVQLASEAVDEAMVRAYVKWRSVRKMSNAEGWVYRVAYRWSIDQLRRRTRERKLLPRLLEHPDAQSPAVEPGLSSALDALPIEQRAVVVLACAFDWSHNEIAGALGIRPGTVKSRLHRGLEHLRKEMNA
ncbi:MAG: RNA polymerase sigma factor [Acidimicrobiia bacterium]|nr:RNA polymerase sigma factor [Acidimicrobiia bacterium]